MTERPEVSADRVKLRSVMLRSLALLVGIIFVAELLAMSILEQLGGRIASHWLAVLDATLLVVLAAVPAWSVVVWPLARRVTREHRVLREREEALRAEADRRQFELQLGSALDMVDDEQAVCALAHRAVRQLGDDKPAQILIADSSRAHLRIVPGGVDDGAAACAVGSPRQCAAVRSGHALVSRSSAALDACPALAAREGPATMAACFPLAVAGATVGVVHISRSFEDGLPERLLASMPSVMSGVGSRLGVIRAMAASELAASRDALTGLYNRRSFHGRVGEAQRGGRSYALVMADVDHFKRLNDTYGHEMGDRCLKVLAHALRQATRGEDTVARLGGEEFVILLPDTDSSQALVVVQRVRSLLSLAAARAGVPAFTASFGITDCSHHDDIEELLRVADEAMYAAKKAGRDRAVVAGEVPAVASSTPESAAPATADAAGSSGLL